MSTAHAIGTQTAAAPAVRPVSFSVLMPAYNPGVHLRSAIDSVLPQMGPDDELIIQDACSTDTTADVVDGFAESDARVSMISEPDGGQSDALNRALRRARRDWIVWLNADDVVLPGALDGVRREVTLHPDLELICGASQILRAGGETVDVFRGRELTTATLLRVGCATFSGSVVVRRELLMAAGGFRDDLHCTMDLALQFELAARHPRQVVIEEPLGALRFHSASKTANLWRDFVRESWQLRRHHAHSPGDWLDAVRGEVLQLASVPVFRLRLTATYRRVRRCLVR